MDTIYRELSCESALNKLKRSIPYGWDLNVYRGCAHGCVYCYAQYSHKYLEDDSFFSHIYAKTNIVEQLERELSQPDWKRDVINIGGVTDSYQPAEETCRLMPEILKLLIRYKTPAIISTKSTLILRDYDLIDELSRLTYINVAATITTMDEAVRKSIEPCSAPSEARFAMLKEFRKTNASIGLHMMPITPYVTDGSENLEALFANARDVQVHYALPGTLYLRGQSRKTFFDWAQAAVPQQYPALLQLYKTGGADKAYKDALYARLLPLREKYGLSGSYMAPMREKMGK